MFISPAPLTLLSLWSLLAGGRKEWLELLRPEIPVKIRKSLVAEGLLLENKEKPSPDEFIRINGAKKKAAKTIASRLRLILTDKGIIYLQDHLDFPVAPNHKSAGLVLNWLFSQLSLKSSKFGDMAQLFDLLESKTDKLSSDKIILLEKLKSLDRSLFMPGGGLRLKALRKALPEYPRRQLDDLLWELQKDGRLVLCLFDDPSEIDSEDERAAINKSGMVRHYLFLK
ncbi:MAG: hypothetical protein LBT62_00730 [Deltaproteobacteria bacterium]|jgi:hypothetical protein|nr:hypothetical protein [Deltaproteobacteria bacterium]